MKNNLYHILMKLNSYTKIKRHSLSHNLNILRFCLFFLILNVIQVSRAITYSQSATLTFQMTNTSIEEVLNIIEEKSDFHFLYNKEVVNVERKVTIVAKDETIVPVLNNLFHDSDISYAISDRQIVLNKKSAFQFVAQQGIRITGTVTDPNGEPIIGSNVVEKRTTNGVITDIDGKFQLTVSPGAVLVISYVGYLQKEVTVGNQTSLQIVLVEDTRTLDEVVVIGYGVVKKSDLAGSVSSVSSRAFKDEPVIRLDDALQGRMAGVQVTNTTGMIGDGAKIRVRGTTSLNKSNDPLYVVDGIIGAGAVNTSDIESIEVLKDASATAIYGSRGANGVVLITTKKGKEGRPQITFESNLGMA
ncbi:TonB-dependent receptor SusC, partial [termite gut metagenome]